MEDLLFKLTGWFMLWMKSLPTVWNYFIMTIIFGAFWYLVKRFIEWTSQKVVGIKPEWTLKEFKQSFTSHSGSRHLSMSYITYGYCAFHFYVLAFACVHELIFDHGFEIWFQ